LFFSCFVILSDCCFLYQSMCRDSRIIPGAAATEIELAKRLKEFSLKETGQVILAWCSITFHENMLLVKKQKGLNMH